MSYVVLNNYKYVLKNKETGKVREILEIVGPVREVKPESKMGGFGEDKLEKSRLVEGYSYDHIDPTKGIYSKSNPIGKTLLEYESNSRTDKIVKVKNENNERKEYLIVERSER